MLPALIFSPVVEGDEVFSICRKSGKVGKRMENCLKEGKSCDSQWSIGSTVMTVDTFDANVIWQENNSLDLHGFYSTALEEVEVLHITRVCHEFNIPNSYSYSWAPSRCMSLALCPGEYSLGHHAKAVKIVSIAKCG